MTLTFEHCLKFGMGNIIALQILNSIDSVVQENTNVPDSVVGFPNVSASSSHENDFSYTHLCISTELFTRSLWTHEVANSLYQWGGGKGVQKRELASPTCHRPNFKCSNSFFLKIRFPCTV